MVVTKRHSLDDRIQGLIASGNTKAAGDAVQSFSIRYGHLNERIDRLEYSQKNAFQAVLHRELEKVLARFEELEWLGQKESLVRSRCESAEAIEQFNLRSDRVDYLLERLPVVEMLAIAAVLHQELERVLLIFEKHQWLQDARVKSMPSSEARWRWN